MKDVAGKEDNRSNGKGAKPGKSVRAECGSP